LGGLPPFQISKIPTNQTASLGGSASFTIETRHYDTNGICCITNAVPLRWKKNGIVIPGVTSATLSVTNVRLSDAATYNVVVGEVDSPPYTLTVRLNPRFLSAALSASGQFEATIAAKVGARIVIEASSNLTDWTPVLTLTNATGTVQFTDPFPQNCDRRFFRALSE
jgi:hypothetical protein